MRWLRTGAGVPRLAVRPAPPRDRGSWRPRRRWPAHQPQQWERQARPTNTDVLYYIDTTIACPIEPDSCHYLRNGLADVGRVTGEVIRYG